MKVTLAAVSWSLLATSGCASWVPASPPLARDLEPKPQKLLPRQSGNGTSGEWPYGPLSTRGRDIVNSRGEVVTWAGLNWPLSGETMVPEGLEHKSAEAILDDIVSVGFNSIRM
ncbi:hypothetical protein SLS62_005794 [Diatrype stigma]|uniref:Cellulase n=1 Tax=Diatrype stigma TaxID=117547 RepID=A0AAN9UUA0_9PEZI